MNYGRLNLVVVYQVFRILTLLLDQVHKETSMKIPSLLKTAKFIHTLILRKNTNNLPTMITTDRTNKIYNIEKKLTSSLQSGRNKTKYKYHI